MFYQWRLQGHKSNFLEKIQLKKYHFRAQNKLDLRKYLLDDVRT